MHPRRLAEAMGRWLDRREGAETFAALRVGVGLSTLLAVGGVVAPGVHRVVWLGPEHGGYDAPEAGLLVALLGGPGPAVVEGLAAAALGAGALLVVGLFSRASALVAVLTCQALFGLDRSSGGGHDALLTNALWLLCLGSPGATWSLDAWRRHRRLAVDEPVASWPRHLAVVQLALLYLTAGLHKVGVEWTPWGGFSALYYALQQPHLTRADLGPALRLLYPLTQLATAATMAFELGFPALLAAHALGWLRRDPRPLLLPLGVMLHGGIWLTMDLGPFSAISLALYPCLYPPEGWRALARSLKRARALRQRATALTRTARRSRARWPARCGR